MTKNLIICILQKWGNGNAMIEEVICIIMAFSRKIQFVVRAAPMVFLLCTVLVLVGSSSNPWKFLNRGSNFFLRSLSGPGGR